VAPGGRSAGATHWARVTFICEILWVRGNRVNYLVKSIKVEIEGLLHRGLDLSASLATLPALFYSSVANG